LAYARNGDTQMKDTRENDTARRNVGSDGHKTDGGPLTVGNVMTRQVIMLSPHHSFSDSVSLMAKHSFRHFLVVDASGKLAGVVSDRDILRVLARTSNWQGTSVSQFMSRDVISVKPDTEISLAVGKMLSKRINCLPVVDDNNNVCGIITSTDFLKTYRSMQESLEKQAKSLKSVKKK
jgi:CBS domain-containing membrane protein